MGSPSPKHSLISGNLRRLASLASLSLFAVSGVAVRQLLNSVYAPQFYTLLLANTIGCLLMGFFTTDRIAKNTCSPHPLQLGFTTGFCGVLTSFSGWVNSFTLANASHAASEIVCGLSLPFVAYAIGRDLAELIPSQHVNLLASVVATLLSLAPILIYSLNPSLLSSATLLLAIFGCNTRYALTKLLNQKMFPFGTLVANVLACVVLAIYTDMQPVKDGFCGGLSTVSLFVHEVMTMRSNNFILTSLAYVLASVALGTASMALTYNVI